MKFRSVSTKLNIAIIGVSIASIIVASVVLFEYAKKLKLMPIRVQKKNSSAARKIG